MPTAAKRTREEMDSGTYYVSAEDLYKTYQPDLVRHIMMHYGQPRAEAEDFTQDLFRKLLGRIPPGFQPATEGEGQSPQSFLRFLLRGDVKNYRKSAARRTTTVTAPQDLPDRADENAGPPEEPFDLQARLEQETEGLNPALMQIFKYAVFERLTYAQIGELVGIPEGTVGSRLTEARKILKPAFERIRLGHTKMRPAGR